MFRKVRELQECKVDVVNTQTSHSERITSLEEQLILLRESIELMAKDIKEVKREAQ